MLRIEKIPFEEMVDEYLEEYKEESKRIETLYDFIHKRGRLEKSLQRGHLTGSAWVINRDRNKILLTHHYKLNKWLQLGGHVEDGENVMDAAYRECIEESGVDCINFIDEKIFDIDIHLIPEYKNEKEHYHYDIRFIFEADSNEELQITNESRDMRWINLEDIEKYNNDESIIRMVEKTIKYR